MVTHEHQILGFQEEEALGTKRREKYGWVNGRVSRRSREGQRDHPSRRELVTHVRSCQEVETVKH